MNATTTRLLKAFFAKIGIISTPTFRVTPKSVVVQLFYYSAKGAAPTGQALNNLITVLTNIYGGKTVELRCIRVQRPYLNSSILAQFLALNASKYRFNRLQHALYKSVGMVKPATALLDSFIPSLPSGRTSLPAHIAGIKIQLSGLLTTQRAAPRKTVSTASVGTFNSPSITQVSTGGNGSGGASAPSSAALGTTVEYSSSTMKSRLGAYTVKV
jgi:hypothetical protein